MQIHELNNFNGTPGSTNYLAIDNGSDTARISGTDLLAPVNARIDNVVLQNKSESVNLFAGNISKGGGTYTLSESAVNFDFLEFIFYFNAQTVATTRVRPNADILVSVPGFDATLSVPGLDVTRLSVSINGTSFRVTQAYDWAWNGVEDTNASVTPSWAWADQLSIEVYGIRYAQLDSTEVTDLRTAHDGTVYSTARAAREADYNALDSEIQDNYEKIDTKIYNMLGTGADFSGSTLPPGWEADHATYTIGSGTFNITVNSRYGGYKKPVSLVANHIYYIYAYLKTDSPLVSLNWNGVQVVNAKGLGEFEFISRTTTFTSSGSRKVMVTDARASGYNAIQVKEIGVIDLTSCFGAGNEPDQEDIDSILAYCNYRIIDNANVGGLSRSNLNNIINLQNSLDYYKTIPVPYHGTINGIADRIDLEKNGLLFKASTISFSTDGYGYCGVQFFLENPQVGKTVKVKCASIVGSNYVNSIRADCLDSNGQRITGTENHTSGTELDCVVLEGTAKVEITLFACWGTALASGSIVTFNDVSITMTEISNEEDIYLRPTGHHSKIASTVNESSVSVASRLYKAKEIKIVTDGNAYSGVYFNIYEPIVGDVITVKCKSRTGGNHPAIMRADCLDANGQRIAGRENTTSGTVLNCLVLEGTARVEITLFGCWGTALASGTQVSFNDVEIMTSEVFGTSGNLLYYGEPIVITDEYKKPNKCNYDVWKDFVGADIPNLASYNLYKQQSIAIYKDYVFMFNEGGDGLVLDFNTKAILSRISTTPTSYQHHNSAQFTDIYYSANDEFPILMTSMCGNQSEELTEYDVAQFYRVQRSGTSFTFTLINTLKTDFITRGISWGVDNTNNKLYMAGGRTGYSEPDFVCEFYVWEMPSRSQILSGNVITVREVDALSYMSYPRFTVQGVFANGGILYAGRSIENVGQFVYAIDVQANRFLSEIPLTDYKEVEGLAIYKNNIYVSQKNGVDTSATNPAIIYEISFGY